MLATLHDLWPPASQLLCNKLVIPLRHPIACNWSVLQLGAPMLRGLLQHWKSVQGASRHFSTQARSMGVKVFIVYYSMCVPWCLIFSCFLGNFVITHHHGQRVHQSLNAGGLRAGRYGHVAKLAEKEKEGVDSVEGAEGILFQVHHPGCRRTHYHA